MGVDGAMSALHHKVAATLERKLARNNKIIRGADRRAVGGCGGGRANERRAVKRPIKRLSPTRQLTRSQYRSSAIPLQPRNGQPHPRGPDSEAIIRLGGGFSTARTGTNVRVRN